MEFIVFLNFNSYGLIYKRSLYCCFTFFLFILFIFHLQQGVEGSNTSFPHRKVTWLSIFFCYQNVFHARCKFKISFNEKFV